MSRNEKPTFESTTILMSIDRNEATPESGFRASRSGTGDEPAKYKGEHVPVTPLTARQAAIAARSVYSYQSQKCWPSWLKRPDHQYSVSAEKQHAPKFVMHAKKAS